jgi:tetratricopeptide (TPR) repeat protein
MFEELREIPYDTALAVASEATRNLMYGKIFPAGGDDEPLENKQLLERMRSEIEAAEGAPLAQISPERSRSYVPALSKVIQGLAAEHFGLNPERGTTLLEELRHIPIHPASERKPEPNSRAKDTFEMGVRLFNAGDFPRAEKEFECAIMMEPGYAGVLNRSIVESFKDINEWDKAVTAFRFLVRVAPNYQPARNNFAVAFAKRAWQCARRDAFVDALNIYSDALPVGASKQIRETVLANMSACQNRLAYRAMTEGRLFDFLRHMYEACTLWQSEANRHNLGLAQAIFGVSLLEKGLHAEARKHFEAAEDAGVVNPAIINNLGIALAALELPSEAARRFERALELDPGDASISHNLEMVKTNTFSVADALVQGNSMPAAWAQIDVISQDFVEPAETIGSALYNLAA